jgi:prepilin-type N-terminal cleavage/methylation domain-containing protein/prepilin-type processing-associated H-X9-DG protein
MAPDTSSSRRGFSLTELLTVIGLITLLGSLLVPVMSKVRAAANNTTCLSNLRQMGVAWTMYVTEQHGRLPDYAWGPPKVTPRSAWYGYWTGILDTNGVRDRAILCPAAGEETPTGENQGYGTVSYAWSGKYAESTNAVRFKDGNYRVSSYGYNRFLTAGGAFNAAGKACHIGAVKDQGNVPMFLDCAYADVGPENYKESLPAGAPPNLRGDAAKPGAPEHWRFLMARHGRGINVAMADGSGQWVRLEDTYLLQWNGKWTPYRLRLPAK